MKEIKTSAARVWITYGVAGFALGVGLISLSAIGLVAHQAANPPPTQTPVPTPTIAAEAILDQAYQLLYVDGNAQQVLDLLGPHLEEFTDPDNLARALEYLGNAELFLGHYQLATTYFERLIQISPTPVNYAMIARVYDAGGDLEHALSYYLLYLESDDPSLSEDIRRVVEDRVNQIQETLTGFTSTPALTPQSTLTPSLQALLEDVQQALYVAGDPQFVIDNLEPHLDEFSNPGDLARALEYLARAELLLGHYQFSAAYFERLIQISPTPKNYADLAAVYEAGGELEKALANYLILLELENTSITGEERQLAEERVAVIQGILADLTPTPFP